MGFLLESLDKMWFTNEESSAGINGHLRAMDYSRPIPVIPS